MRDRAARRARSRRDAARPARRGGRRARPQRRWEVDAAALSERAPPDRPRPDCARRRRARLTRGGGARASRAATRGGRVPGLPAVRPPERTRERRVRPPRVSSRSGSPIRRTADPHSSRAVRRNESRSRAHSRRARVCCCSTSRSPPSTRRRARRYAEICDSISTRSTACGSSSRTTPSMRMRSQTGLS
jgi:hypothetical protein